MPLTVFLLASCLLPCIVAGPMGQHDHNSREEEKRDFSKRDAALCDYLCSINKAGPACNCSGVNTTHSETKRLSNSFDIKRSVLPSKDNLKVITYDMKTSTKATEYASVKSSLYSQKRLKFDVFRKSYSIHKESKKRGEKRVNRDIDALCDYLCSIGEGGDACLCSQPSLPGK